MNLCPLAQRVIEIKGGLIVKARCEAGEQLQSVVTVGDDFFQQAATDGVVELLTQGRRFHFHALDWARQRLKEMGVFEAEDGLRWAAAQGLVLSVWRNGPI